MSTRDFVGYGPNPPVVEWPNGAKIAVSVVVNYKKRCCSWQHHRPNPASCLDR